MYVVQTDVRARARTHTFPDRPCEWPYTWITKLLPSFRTCCHFLTFIPQRSARLFIPTHLRDDGWRRVHEAPQNPALVHFLNFSTQTPEPNSPHTKRPTNPNSTSGNASCAQTLTWRWFL